MNNNKTFTTHEDPRKYEVFSNEKLPQLEYTVNIDGCGCCPRGDIIAIKAKSKNGKTFLATLFASAILGAHLRKFMPMTSRRLTHCYISIPSRIE